MICRPDAREKNEEEIQRMKLKARLDEQMRECEERWNRFLAAREVRLAARTTP